MKIGGLVTAGEIDYSVFTHSSNKNNHMPNNEK